MSLLVVDASVGVKWFVPEVHATEARQWRSGRDELHAPAFFFDLETANILWKKVRHAEITRADAELILFDSAGVPGGVGGEHSDRAGSVAGNKLPRLPCFNVSTP